MDYEKAYKDALERMKSWARGEHPECFSEAQKAAEFVFPELKNKDEEIREWLIDWAKAVNWSEQFTITKEQVLAWLEKQGDNNNQNWKPSKGQINALEHFVRSIAESCYGSPYDDNTNLLNSLINDLYKLEKQGEQKPAAWSKDDEAMFQSCTGAIWAADYYLYEDKQDMEAWLKSIKDRIGG